MLDKIINQGSYQFTGNIQQLKKFLGGFKVTEVITDGWIQGINLYSCYAEFKYHNEIHKVEIVSDFTGKNILNIYYKGKKHK